MQCTYHCSTHLWSLMLGYYTSIMAWCQPSLRFAMYNFCLVEGERNKKREGCLPLAKEWSLTK
jgi:hypothetical protein